MNLLRCSPLLLLLALPGWTGQVWAAEAEAPKDEALKAEAPKAEAPKEAPKLTYSKGGADTCLGCHDDVVTLAIFRGPHADNPSLQGTFANEQQSASTIESAIETTVAKMNFIKRPIARSRLKKTNEAHRRVEIGMTACLMRRPASMSRATFSGTSSSPRRGASTTA